MLQHVQGRGRGAAGAGDLLAQLGGLEAGLLEVLPRTGARLAHQEDGLVAGEAEAFGGLHQGFGHAEEVGRAAAADGGDGIHA